MIIGRYGSAIIDEGSGAIEARGMNYEAVQADVQVRVYAWPELQGVTDATDRRAGSCWPATAS